MSGGYMTLPWYFQLPEWTYKLSEAHSFYRSQEKNTRVVIKRVRLKPKSPSGINGLESPLDK